MKKNIVSIIILALSVANLVLSALLVFTFVPEAKKTDKLVTEICSVLKLELDSSGVKDKVELKDLVYYSLEDKVNISIIDQNNTVHYAQVSATLTLNKTSSDYSTFSSKIETGLDSVIYDYTLPADFDNSNHYDGHTDVEIYQELLVLDPLACQKIDPNNRKRLITALNYYLQYHQSIFTNNNKEVLYYDALFIYLKPENKDALNQKNALRIQRMFDEG